MFSIVFPPYLDFKHPDIDHFFFHNMLEDIKQFVAAVQETSYRTKIVSLFSCHLLILRVFAIGGRQRPLPVFIPGYWKHIATTVEPWLGRYH